MPDTVLTFDPGNTSDRTYVVTQTVTRIQVFGGGSHYNADDPVFAGSLWNGGARLIVDNPPFVPGDVLTIRLGGPGRGGIGGYNGGGSSLVASPINYGLGGGGCTEVWLNGTLWAVAGGQAGGFRFQFPDDVIVSPWYDFPQLLIAEPQPTASENPRVPIVMPTTVDVYTLKDDEPAVGPHTEGDPGGDHDGADGTPGILLFTSGAGGGGYVGGASGGSGYYVTDEPGYDPDFFMWAQGRVGCSYLAIDTPYKVPSGDGRWFVTAEGDVGAVWIDSPPPGRRKWSVGRIGF